MAWLVKLDARARQWPKPVHWAYLGVKWYLVIGGAIVLTVYFLDRMGFPVLQR